MSTFEAASAASVLPPPPPPALCDGPLSALHLSELRRLRHAARREEAGLSFARRLLQGRIDILRAELARRRRVSPPVGSPVLDRLPEILTDAPTPHRASARHVTLTPPPGDAYRRLVATVLGEVALSDLAARTDEELRQALRRLDDHEQRLSQRRQELHRAADRCGAEIARRYREGEAHVDDLLS